MAAESEYSRRVREMLEEARAAAVDDVLFIRQVLDVADLDNLPERNWTEINEILRLARYRNSAGRAE